MSIVQALGHAARAPVVGWPAAQSPWRWTRVERRLKRTIFPQRQKNMWQKSGNWPGGGNGGEGGSASVPIRSSTSSAIFKVKTHSHRAPNPNGQDPPTVKNYGSFYSEGDNTVELKGVKRFPLLRAILMQAIALIQPLCNAISAWVVRMG